jgi:FixJ family two-component response regulator
MKTPIKPAGPIVYVIDDDKSICVALESLFRSVGLAAETFSSTQEFLAYGRPAGPSCLILDVRLRGESGLEFQDALAGRDLHMPIVFVTGYGDIAMTVKAMKAGAQDFLAKPFRDQDVLDAVAHALARDGQRLSDEQSLSALRESYGTLTQREREVVGYVLSGLLNKQIASEMNVSEVTVKMHRGQAMRKMGARSVADLLRKTQALGIQPSLTAKS